MNGQPTIRNEIQVWRILVFTGILALVFGVFISRLYILQVVQAEDWTAKAAENSTQVLNLPHCEG